MATVCDYKTLDCPECFKKFITPRLLPCSHTFCEECLGEYVKTHAQDGSGFTCPICAAPTVPSDSSLPLDKWASVFPLNTVINSLLESTKILDESDMNCELCKLDGETNMAEVYCTECKEKFCNSCYKSHQRMNQLKHHKTVPVEEMGQYMQVNYKLDYDCGRHNKKLKLFCLDHRELCCDVCVAANHRQCNDVRSIDDIARDQSQRSTYDYTSIIRDFKKLKTEMEKIMTQKKTNAKEVLQEKDQILNDMDIRIDTIIGYVNKLRNIFRSETEQMYEETENLIHENEKNIQSLMTNIDNSSEILEVLEKNGTLQQKFTAFEHLRSQIMSHYNQINLRLKDSVEVHFTLKVSTFIRDMEKTLQSVGSVEVLKKTSTMSRDLLHGTDRIMKNLNSRTRINSDKYAAQVEKVKDLMTSQVTFVKAVTSDKFDSNACLTGGIFLSNGRLVMSDFLNYRLVELDNDYKVVKNYKVDGKPTDVAAGNEDNEIYIAVNEKYIYKCTLHADLTVVSKIKAPSDTWGIAVCGDNIIVSTNNAVVILTQDGSTVRSIPKSGNCGYVAVSQTQRTIYHRDNDDVVCRTWEGQEVFRYQRQQLKVPRGMCVDRHNSLYLCGMNSHNAHQVSSSNGQKSRIIQLHKISRPWSVILHPHKNQLVVTSTDEDTVCEIYTLG